MAVAIVITAMVMKMIAQLTCPKSSTPNNQLQGLPTDGNVVVVTIA
jgi:hypothetical protein